MSENFVSDYISENPDSVKNESESEKSCQEPEKKDQEKKKTSGIIIGATPELLTRLEQHAKLIEWSITVLRNAQAERQRKKAADKEYWKAERKRVRALWAHPPVPWHQQTTIRRTTKQHEVDEKSTSSYPSSSPTPGTSDNQE